MKNKFLCFIALVICCLTIFCSCEEPIEQSGESQEQGNRFVLLSQQDCNRDNFKVYVDRETRVQYAVYRGVECVEMHPLVDENGEPLLYEGELE